ncbi:PAS domain-containing protein [Planosporangium flavigriseum]|uniref:histidine kinase n=1 Tax=Planosporangium flavigriseum TaxID=373681 RepID=A0A8J3LF16_9ACTN|nr:PAS domain-containing protein [Planosporangium flavigriseum]NJC64625.1 PAS domain-containing protein [Planosporangium flavigriseum]GIG71892.1 hypothetical protein Pfl04_02960 [Planosporangium flavigriseum]
MSGPHGAPDLSDRSGDSVAGASYQPADGDYRLLVEAAPHLMWIAGPDGAIQYGNPGWYEYTGLPADANLGQRWISLVHPDDADRVSTGWQEASRAGTVHELTYRLRRADGQFRWHHCRSLAVRDADGRITKWMGTATDVDDQKGLEGSLQRAERKDAETLTLLEALQSAAPVGLGFVDREFRLIHANATLLGANDMVSTISGASLKQQLGRPVAELVPAIWPQLETAYRRVLDTGEAVLNMEVTGSLPAEPERVHSWLTSFYPARVGTEIIGIGVVVVDVTERMESAVFRSVVMENMAEGLCTVDDAGRLTSMNRAASRMLGWQEDELRGREMHGILHVQAADGAPLRASECLLREAQLEGRPLTVSDQVFVRKDGSTFPVSYSSAPLRVGARVAGSVIVFRDITELRERQRREIELRHGQKLQELGRLSAGLAHEINTPIQFVGDNTRFLAEVYQEMLELLLVYREFMDPSSGSIPWDERVKRVAEAERKADIDYLASEVPSAVEQSLEGVGRVASLVRAMKSFSYKDANDRSYADVNDALTTTLTVASNALKDIADVTLDLGEIPRVLCSLGDLNQVFLNLLVNAADALQDKGERGEIRVSTRAEGGVVMITIADNGSGIPEDLHELIFEPFFTTKEVGKGTGQGLALARAVVVDGHGGTIDVHSVPGEGTEFILRLPVDGRRLTSP